MATITFWFDFTSPYSYLAAYRLQHEAPFDAADIDWQPVFLGGLFKEVGNVPPATVPGKGAYMLADLNRLARHYAIPFRFPSNFPINSLLALRGAMALKRADAPQLAAYCDALFRAYWVEDRNISEPDVWAEVVSEMGLDADDLRRQASDEENKEAVKANTRRAADQEMFGVPTFVLNGEMYWGVDRMFLLAPVLTA